MNPLKILLFIGAVMVCLGGIMFVFPDNGISISEDFTMHYPSWKGFWSKNKAAYTPLPDFVLAADSASTDFLEAEVADTAVPVPLAGDTGKVKLDSLILQKKIVHRLEFDSCAPNVLHTFFATLDAASSGQGIHIVHFGDSQLEGDRMSGYLRDRLQRQFGGGGPGLISVIPAYNQASVKQTVSGPWERYTIFGKNITNPAHTRYGVMGAFSRFTPLLPDSAHTTAYTASAQLITSKGAYPNARVYDYLTVYYGPTTQPCEIEILSGAEVIVLDTLTGQNKLNTYTLKLDRTAHDIKINFESLDGPDIYGFNLDTPEGVTVDNVAMRGSSGTTYTRTDFDVLSGMMKHMNATLAIMQFGGNSVPYIQDTTECVNFGKQFYRQLMVMKRAKPGIGIIVIGPSDMSFKEGDLYKTYPYLPVLIAEMRKATHDAGGVYWDMYSAMGGAQSMPTWVNADPPLAVQDYIHFSPRGARIMAELFYDALYTSYYQYQVAQKKEEL
ncbi:hypothetical protein BH09BAC1_BH09BAC1_08350 [soil metagenome]